MFFESWTGLLLLAAVIAAAIGLGYVLSRRPEMAAWRSSRLARLPWSFYAVATVFFFGLALYSWTASLGIAMVVGHGVFTALEAFMAVRQYAAQRPRFHATHLTAPVLLVAMLAAAFHPLSAFAVPLASAVAAVVVLVMFIRYLRTPLPSQV
jgi:hypothetical protein